jgi:hypothetical protein
MFVDELEQRRFAAPIGTCQSDERASWQLQVQILKDRMGVIASTQV